MVSASPFIFGVSAEFNERARPGRNLMTDVQDRVADLTERLNQAAVTGMTQAVWADVQPNKVQIIEVPSGRTRTFKQVNDNANRLVRLMRNAGLKAGDSVALLCSNRAEFVEVLSACQRGGFRITPVNWHLKADEVSYIVSDCEAKALFAEARYPAGQVAGDECKDLLLKVAIDGDVEGFVNYEEALAPLDASNITDPTLGNQMMYTSGTTGRPKGVYRPNPVVPTASAASTRAAYDPDESVQMCAGPAYHAAPLAFDVRASMNNGVPLVFIDKWDSELVLKTIAEKKVTHMHLVPIMFQRLLALPEEVKKKYDVSHVKYIIHGAAPCSPEVKRAMIDWFGPIVHEYYAGSEGGAGFFIFAEEWLKKPGSVGKRPALLQVRILDDEGNECPPGVPGTIYHQLPPGGGFEYFKDPEKTAKSRVGDFFTLGDVGYFDEDDYLFLTGRDKFTIISGGVNIYPQEIENALVLHPAVEDVAVIGLPDEEMGERVHAVVVPAADRADDPGLAEEILGALRGKISDFKIPRGIDFVEELPRTPTGKLVKRRIVEQYV